MVRPGAGQRAKVSPRLNTLKWKYYLKRPGPTLCHIDKIGRPRYRNYFPNNEKYTVFNSKKYLLYISYLKAKEFIWPLLTLLAIIDCFQELHGNVYTRKCRSRAGRVSQTWHPDLVVSGPGLVLLLSSVFVFVVFDGFFAVFCCFPLFPIFWCTGLIGRGSGQTESPLWPECA